MSAFGLTQRCVAPTCFTPRRQAPIRRQPHHLSRAFLDGTAATSVIQQGVAFAAVLAAETAYTRTKVPEADPGRPELVPCALGVGSVAGSTALVALGSGLLQTVGLATGLASSIALFFYQLKRFRDLEYTDREWPGPKAWPAGMALISFFALNVFLQGLRSDFSV